MNVNAAKMIRNKMTDRCNQATEMRLQRQGVELTQRAGEIKLSLYNREEDPLVEGVTQFHYLGRILDHTDNACPEVHQNIDKARSL